MRWFFGFFLISGFCSVLYELVWLRMSMAEFGVTTALVSIVLSMFMAGLGLGSWGSGYLLRRFGDRIRFPALRLYAATELAIGVSAILVPYQLRWGRDLVEHLGLSSSTSYYLVSGSWVALTLVPWCAFMGATIPVGMLAIQRRFPDESRRGFSYLYLANVLGAVAGATVPLLLIEILGFRGTLRIGAGFNALLAAAAMALTLGLPAREKAAASPAAVAPSPTGQLARDRKLLALLFTTGLTSMGMEVVWIRQFTPYVGTVVYAFASILSLYLVATFCGSRIYRKWSRTHQQESGTIWMLLGLFALLPLIASDPRYAMLSGLRVALGIVPFSAALGFLTPMLVDRWSGGDPDRAGSAYAVNVAGCILGPLLAGFLLLPWMDHRWALFALSLPWLVIGMKPDLCLSTPVKQTWRPAFAGGYALVAILLVFTCKEFEQLFPKRRIERDHTATVASIGEGMQKRLLVNGIGMTELTPVTKMMAHMPLSFLDRAPRNALAVCFGMGTTYRSLVSWDIATTSVELVPSVPRLFGYFHPDGPPLLHLPSAHVVIDDGRRYLERSSQQYDMITIDPPPPVEAAGSSLLYSKEFYSVAKRRLRPGGILQQWLPQGEPVVISAVARALHESFPYVRVFGSVEHWGFHFLASDRPIPDRTPAELVQRMPAKAVADLMEWGPEASPQRQFEVVLNSEVPLADLMALAPDAPALQDDRPVNEYYALRRHMPGLLAHLQGTKPVSTAVRTSAAP